MSSKADIYKAYNDLRQDLSLTADEIAEVMYTRFPSAFEDMLPTSIVPMIQYWAKLDDVPLVHAPRGRKAGKSPFRKGEEVVDEDREAILERHAEELAHYDMKRPGHLYRDAKVNVAEIERSYTYVWDLETTDLNTFMGRTLMCSMMDLATLEMQTRTVLEFCHDEITQDSLDSAERDLLDWVVDRHEEADALIGHNTVGFDNGFIRGRLAALDMRRTLPKRQHWDTMQIAKFGFKGRPQGASMKNLADFFRLPVQKDEPSKWDWAGSREVHEAALERLVYRCEEDVRVNALLWNKLRRYFHEWRGK